MNTPTMITKRQNAILVAIGKHWQAHGNAPTCRNLKDTLQMSYETLHKELQTLKLEGFIDFRLNSAGNIAARTLKLKDNPKTQLKRGHVYEVVGGTPNSFLLPEFDRFRIMEIFPTYVYGKALYQGGMTITTTLARSAIIREVTG